MKVIKKLWKQDAVLFISAIFAVLSMAAVPPCAEYLGYVNYQVIVLLFCLMAVVSGLKKIGVFTYLSQLLIKKSGSLKGISIILVNLCFFFAMLVTNDVALLTFVPLTLELFREAGNKQKMFVIIMETIAANLGSMATPIGNPQNLFLYSYFNMSIGQFTKAVLPIAALSYVLIMAAMFSYKGDSLHICLEECNSKIDVKKLGVFAALFIVCILTVLKVIDYRLCLIIVAAVIAAVDIRLFKQVDYGLLLTFICFFVFVGNLSSLCGVKDFVSSLLNGRELVVSILICQGISNVPAAVMLSGFTVKSQELLRGVNIGGLGTLVASLASLISFKLYNRSEGSKPSAYIAAFTALNLVFLIILLTFSLFIAN